MGRERGPVIAGLLACGVVALFVICRSGRRDGAALDGVPSGGVRAVPSPRGVLGAGSCSSSGCHAAEVEGHPAWQSAYTVWATRDRHARAAEVLFDPLAARIVASLERGEPSRPQPPAHRNKACVGCHATGAEAVVGEGVSCEACHGPAGDWLVAHTLPGWKTRGNSLGMVDLSDPFVCATRCAGCHVGGPATAEGFIREVSHDLIAAGHPRLSFELRGFKRAEPPHWATASGIEGGPVGEWSLGRLGALDAYLAQVAAQSLASERGDEGVAAVWPEFSAFDCYGCHRPAVPAFDRAGSVVTRAGQRRGVPRLEPMTWSLLDAILPEDAAGTLRSFREDVEANWWRRPSQASIDLCREAIHVARPVVAARLVAMSPAELASQVVGGVEATPFDEAMPWGEAASAHAALSAIVDAVAIERDVSEVQSRLDALRSMLQFPEEERDGQRVQFNGPRGYDARAVQAALREIVDAIAAPDRDPAH